MGDRDLADSTLMFGSDFSWSGYEETPQDAPFYHLVCRGLLAHKLLSDDPSAKFIDRPRKSWIASVHSPHAFVASILYAAFLCTVIIERNQRTIPGSRPTKSRLVVKIGRAPCRERGGREGGGGRA